MKKCLYVALLLAVAACQKAPQRACWKVAGELVTKKVPIQDAKFLKIASHIEVYLFQDSLNYLEWTAGSNIQNFLIVEKNADTLNLYNHNRCQFLRYKHGKASVSIHFTEIKELHLANSEQVKGVGEWAQDELLLYLKEGVGLVDLQLAVQKLVVRNNYGWQELRLSGEASRFFVDLDGSATVDAKKLKVQDSISFRSSSLLTSYLAADQIPLKAQLYGSGDLFYTGSPSVLLKTEYGSGKVRKQ